MPVETVRVLSIQQPFADEIIYGDKWNELRSWCTPYHGPLYIHASSWSGSRKQGSPGPGLVRAIIGKVELVDCLTYNAMFMIELHLRRRRRIPEWLKPLAEYLRQFPKTSWRHGYDLGNFILVEPRPLRTPFSVKGKLYVWYANLPIEELATEDVTPSRSRPLAREYPSLEIPKQMKPLTPLPNRSMTRALYDFVLPFGEEGVQFTDRLLKQFARKYDCHFNKTLVLATMERHSAFEPVPRKKLKQWWRIVPWEDTPWLSTRWQPRSEFFGWNREWHGSPES